MDIPPDFPNPHVRDAYLSPHVDSSTQEFEWGMPDLDGLRQYLFSMLGWDEKKVDGLVVPVIKEMNSRKVKCCLIMHSCNSILTKHPYHDRLLPRHRLGISLTLVSIDQFSTHHEKERTRARECRM